LDYL